jgi:hypothetical protein
VVLPNKRALDMLTVAQGETCTIPGKTAASVFIDQDKFKLIFMNLPTKSISLENKPPTNGSHGKTPGHGYTGFSLLGISTIYFTPFPFGPSLL